MSLKYKNLIKDLGAHLIVSLAIGGLFYIYTRELRLLLAAIAGGILIDTDHLIDYYYCYRQGFSIRKFISVSYLKSGRIYVLLHSWELAGLLLIASFMVPFGLVVVVFSLSLAVHLVIDSIHQKTILPYFLIYRLYHGFNARVILPHYDKCDFDEL